MLQTTSDKAVHIILIKLKKQAAGRRTNFSRNLVLVTVWRPLKRTLLKPRSLYFIED